MKNYFGLLSLVLAIFLSGCTTTSYETSHYVVDDIATQNAPWHVGEVVAESLITVSYDLGRGHSPYYYGTYPVYRVFLGVLPNGHYLVQEFYKENKQKYTDPYELSEKKDVTNSNTFNLRYLSSMQGRYVEWYANGVKHKEWQNSINGRGDGHEIFWYVNGNKWMEGDSVHGAPAGLWKYWYPNGQIRSAEISDCREILSEQEKNELLKKAGYWDLDGKRQSMGEHQEYRRSVYDERFMMDPRPYIKIKAHEPSSLDKLPIAEK